MTAARTSCGPWVIEMMQVSTTPGPNRSMACRRWVNIAAVRVASSDTCVVTADERPMAGQLAGQDGRPCLGVVGVVHAVVLEQFLQQDVERAAVLADLEDAEVEPRRGDDP
jgi:hypothetical protein